MYESYEIVDIPVTCPYNASHRIARSRIQKHIVKCERNYPKDYKLICPYNATHRLFKHEMTEHIVMCPMRKLIEPELYQAAGNRALMTNKLQCDITSSIECNESWDRELESDWIPDTKETIEHTIREGEAEEYKDVRAPRGHSEAALIDFDDYMSEDMESVKSVMGIGRGKFTPKNRHLIERIGQGRVQTPTPKVLSLN